MNPRALPCWLSLVLLWEPTWAEPSFQPVVLDRAYIAYERDVGDIDGDGDSDVVAVQEGDTTLQVFPAPTWIYRNATPSGRWERWTYHQVSSAHVRTFRLSPQGRLRRGRSEEALNEVALTVLLHATADADTVAVSSRLAARVERRRDRKVAPEILTGHE